MVEISQNPNAMHFEKYERNFSGQQLTVNCVTLPAYRADNVIYLFSVMCVRSSLTLENGIDWVLGNRISVTHVDAYVSARGGHSHQAS